MSMNNIGNVYRTTGRISSATQFFDESCRIFLYINDIEGAVQALSNKTAALIEDGGFEEASNVLSLAESLAKNNKKLSVTLLKNRGILLIRKKEFKSAEDILKKALNKVEPANFSEIEAINFALGNTARGDAEPEGTLMICDLMGCNRDMWQYNLFFFFNI